MEEGKKTNALSRIPQSMSFDNTVLERAYQEEAIILRDVIVYVINKKAKNLWDEFTFSLEDFCKEMGYDRSNLQRTKEQFVNPSKKELQKLPIIDEHNFDSAFEYALYRGMKENIVISRRGDKDIEFRSYRVIEDLKVYYNKNTKKDTKRIYSIRLASELMENIFKEYFLIDYKDYSGIKASTTNLLGGFRNFYVFMAQMISLAKQHTTEENNSFIVAIDKLATILNIKSTEEHTKRKFNVKKALNKLKDSLERTSFDFEFVKNGGRFAYYVKFSFPKETLAYFDEKLRAVFFHKLFEECSDEFLKNVLGIQVNKSQWEDYQRKINTKEVRVKFIEWFLDQRDMKAKEIIFRRVYQNTYRVQYPVDKPIDFEGLAV